MSMQACKKEELRSWVDHVGGPDAANYCAAAKLICCETGEWWKIFGSKRLISKLLGSNLNQDKIH